MSVTTMKAQRRLILSKLLVLISILLMVFGLVQDLPFVLCFEPNGQIELEAATTKGSCADWKINNLPSTNAVKQLAKHCFDIPLSHFSAVSEQFKTASSENNPWNTAWLIYGLLAFLPLIGLIPRIPDTRMRWIPPPPLPTLRPIFIKTTVLLL